MQINIVFLPRAKKGICRCLDIKSSAESPQEIKEAWPEPTWTVTPPLYRGRLWEYLPEGQFLKIFTSRSTFLQFLNEIDSWRVCPTHHYLLPFIVTFPIVVPFAMAGKQIASNLCGTGQPSVLLMESVGQDVNRHSGDGLSQLLDVWGPSWWTDSWFWLSAGGLSFSPNSFSLWSLCVGSCGFHTA